MDIALLALAMMLSLAALVWWTARALHRADAVRRENETQLRNQAEVMDHAHDALIVRELDGVIRSWNRGAETLYGWSAAEAVGQHIHVLLHCEGTPLVERDAQLEHTGHWEGELVHTSRDGRQVTVESRQTATRTPDGRLLILESNRDITERKQAEEAVSRSQKTFAELVERSPFGTYIVDSQFRIAMMNAASQEGAFRNVRPVIGRPFAEAMRILWPEPVAAEIIGHFRHTLDTGEPYYSPRLHQPAPRRGDRRVLRVGTASHDAAGRPIRRHLLLLRFHEAAPGRGGGDRRTGARHIPPGVQHDLWRLELLLVRQASDLIESAKAEEALRESEERMQQGPERQATPSPLNGSRPPTACNAPTVAPRF